MRQFLILHEVSIISTNSFRLFSELGYAGSEQVISYLRSGTLQGKDSSSAG